MTDDDLQPGDSEDEMASLSRWWQPYVEVYQRRKLEPYRPTRLKDGTKVADAVERIEDRLGVTVTFRVVNPQDGRQWSILVDGTEAGTVTHVRRKNGRTRYDVTADDLASLVEATVDEG